MTDKNTNAIIIENASYVFNSSCMQYNQNTKKQKQKNNCKMTYIIEPSTMQETFEHKK